LFAEKSGLNIVVLDEGQADPAVARRLYDRDIAVVVRLRTTRGDLGYMTLGFKDSGQAYTSQDRRLLSTAADEIAISMQNALHFQEIQNFNETLQANVNEATRRLRRTNDKLQALDATKDEFISMASHQLRTPLTSVKGYLSMVLEGDVGKLNAQQKQLLTQSYASAQRMVYLISDLLNLSRLSTGKFVIEPVPTSLSEVVQSEIEQLQETAKSRDVTLEFKRPATFPTLLLDETKIHQVVMNFMDNAIYYTPPGGQVVVTLSETATAVEFSVRDNGIGVPKPEQHKLFSKFYRAGNARKARPDGTGLGLFMAKKVIAASGGALVFESEEGKGSTFGFRFSKAKHAVPAGNPVGQPAELAKV
jgi:signal transduction histidine kinase